jgi:hypothetical protein
VRSDHIVMISNYLIIILLYLEEKTPDFFGGFLFLGFGDDLYLDSTVGTFHTKGWTNFFSVQISTFWSQNNVFYDSVRPQSISW